MTIYLDSVTGKVSGVTEGYGEATYVEVRCAGEVSDKMRKVQLMLPDDRFIGHGAPGYQERNIKFYDSDFLSDEDVPNTYWNMYFKGSREETDFVAITSAAKPKWILTMKSTLSLQYDKTERKRQQWTLLAKVCTFPNM